ncbi:alpha/beta hydrolase-fold protein [Lacinutrix jangbogonensis]|uniref:alpha/beta hydrolase-fold protein n=1 Tax=Lacinutrix jangbogonensis TaxID=1469557 RepID=UPI00053DDE4B|nr:alpha/beta hydrolase-fold protein [Lacinutrix jangbogonensis]
MFLLFTLLYLTTNIKAQTISSKNTLGTNFTIKSEILKEDRQIQICVPESYEETDKKFPVLYILDGQRLFPFGVSLLKSFTQFRQTPEFIIVGITNKYPNRFGHFIDDEKKFLHFIEQEVIPFVDTSFRTSKERILFGWEYGGSFVIQTMMDRPNLFDAYLVASPFPLTHKITEIDNFLSEKSSFDKTLYFSVSPNENQVNIGTEKLDSILKLKAHKTFNWSYKKLINEEHRSTPYSTLYSGIKHFYHYFPELQFNTLDEFINAGGLDHVYEYYQKRSLKYGFSKALTDWTMFSLTRTAIRANDYKQFDALVNEFNKTEFISRIKVNRACSIAEFYLKNKHYNTSKKIFTLLAEKHPNSERPLKGLGDSYKALQDDSSASIYYRKAEKLSENKSN